MICELYLNFKRKGNSVYREIWLSPKTQTLVVILQILKVNIMYIILQYVTPITYNSTSGYMSKRTESIHSSRNLIYWIQITHYSIIYIIFTSNICNITNQSYLSFGRKPNFCINTLQYVIPRSPPEYIIFSVWLRPHCAGNHPAYVCQRLRQLEVMAPHLPQHSSSLCVDDRLKRYIEMHCCWDLLISEGFGPEG